MRRNIINRILGASLACVLTLGAFLPNLQAAASSALPAPILLQDAKSTLSATELITGSDLTSKSGAVDNQETAANKTVAGQQLGGEKQLHSTKDGGVAGFANVDFGEGVDQMTLYYAGYTANYTVQLILDDPDNGVYAEITPTQSTGGWSNYIAATFAIPEITGVHTLYLRFAYPSNPSSFLANIPGFKFADTNTAKPVTSVTLNQTSAALNVGQTLRLNPTVEPADATYKGLHYTTSNAEVASVDADGTITAVGQGEAVITAASVHAGQSAVCTVNVTRPAVTGVTLSETEVTMGLHGEHQLIATVQPDAALNKNVTFASSDDTIVTVTGNGLLKAVGEGEATITVTTEEGEFTAECAVTVEAETLVESLSLSKNTANLDKGAMAEVQVTIAPADATVQTYTVVSGDESIAKVDAAGRVIAVGAGTTTITYTSNSTSAKSATLTVHVTAPKETGEVEYSNPIVGGYAPDPSICRGPDGYYLINSSFTSFPGIPVYYSKNMVDWELVSYAASSDEVQFGDNYTNGGLWAPTIRYIESKGAYYMIVKNMSDNKTIITHTTDPKAVAWSDPVYVSDSTGKVLTNVGIDPDLFEDSDGTVYYTEGNEQIAKIDLDTGRIEKLYYNWSGLVDVYTEGPHIYRVGDYYYCTVAEGGTGSDHMTTIARKPVSEGLINTANNREDAQEGWEVAPVYTGYEVIQRYLKQNSQNGRSVLKQQVEAGNVAETTAEPHNPILHNPSGLEIDTCGHSDFVEDENGNWWIVFLGRRDNTGPDLARETFLAPVEWIDGWPVVNGGETITADMTGPAIDTDWQPNEKPVYFGFDTEELNLHFNFIRNIGAHDYSLTANPGYLTLYAIADTIDGKNAASGNNNGQQPSWVGLRQTEKNAVVTTAVDFQPSNNTDAAGLTMYNTSDNQSGPYNLEFVVMKDGDGRKLVVDTGRNVVKEEVGIPADGTVYLRMRVVSKSGGKADVTMAYSMDNQNWTDVITLDVAESINRIQYTGIYFGMYASGRGTDTRTPAKFDFFTYESSEVGKKEIALSDTTTALTMEVGSEKKLQPTVQATDLVNQKLLYAVDSDNNAVTVDADGTVHAIRDGMATVKVISEYDQSQSVTYTIQVGTGEAGNEPVVEGLYYDGTATFDQETGTLTFLTSGLIQNPDLKAQYAEYETDPELPLDAWYNVFTVPASVKNIVIGEGVTVTGRFDIAHDCTIEGENRETSVIYGTAQTRYSHNRGDAYGSEWDKPWEYSSIDVIGAATVQVKNLTVHDPYGYCISGYAKDAVIHCEAVNMIDTREGQQNNSDGFVGQAGSSLTDVYIETADDAVKAYHDLTMTNVEIVMLKNGAPIQFGWNADDDEDTDVVIEGLTITTRDGIDRYNRGVFSWVSKDNTKVITVTANNVHINVPNANLFEMNPATGTANITMTNATVVTKGEGTNNTMGTVTITPPQQASSPMDGKVCIVDDLYYDAGGAVWDAATGTLTFTKSGTMIDKSEYDKYYPQERQDLSLDALYTGWSVPASVKKIVIEAGVSVNGRFNVRNNLTIEGEDRETSQIYGTEETRYSKKREPVYGSSMIAPYSYSMVDVKGNCVVYVKNLTVLDPYGYCISGYSDGAVIHCDSVNMIDSRGGNENNSDGFVGRPGSSLTNCYFETGDDAIKIYRSMTITDCTIKMLENGAPIQMGWNMGDDVDTEVTIQGLDIITDPSIQSYNQGVFAWVSAENTKTIKITADDVDVDVPNASLFVMNPTGGHVDFTFTNFTYNTKDLGYSKVPGTISINGEIVDLTPEEVEYNAEALYGTPIMDGQVDAIWEMAPAITLDQVRMGTTEAYAIYKLMWDEENLYVLADVYADGALNCENTSGIWENDCVEIFLDADNTKENTSGGGGNYDVDDRHILINYEGDKVAFDSKNQVDDVVSATEITDYGYRMEVKVPFRMERSEGDVIGFDGQICSTNGGSKRAAIVGWAGDLNVADQGPASWGNVTLVKETAQMCIVTFDTNGGNAIAAVEVEKGTPVSKPATPVKAGWIFAGWYRDPDLKNPYNFAEPVTEDMTLYAKWYVKNTGGTPVHPAQPAEPVESERVDFIDVHPTDWYYEAVTYAAEHGLMNGTGSNRFSPEDQTTRAMILTVLYRLAGSPAVQSDGETWYSDARAWAIQQGISDGTNPTGFVTREQLAAILYRYAGENAGNGTLSMYPDASQVSAWAKDAMIWATENGIINGMGGRLNPQGYATRAQVAAMLMRFLEL